MRVIVQRTQRRFQAVLVMVVLTLGSILLSARTNENLNLIELKGAELCKLCNFSSETRMETTSVFLISKDKMSTEMKTRLQVLKQNCDRYKGSKNFKSVLKKKIPTTLSAENVHICKVPKCGSTYWTSAILIISGKSTINELANIDMEVIHGPLQEKIIKRDLTANASHTMVLVARNPWTRLYSAYMDKIFRRQFDFIKDIKRMISKRTNYCDETPTFEEFLEFIIFRNKMMLSLDPHWMPISTLCRVCGTEYKYILKMESFVKESTYLLNELIPENSERKNELMSLLTDQYHTESISQVVRSFSHQMQNTTECFSFIDTMKRLWISLQSQGLISDDVLFDPILFKNLSAFNEQEIVELFLAKRTEKILTLDEIRLQRNRHFNRAYTTVKQQVISEIQNVFKNDFMLFSYDEHLPVHLFN